MHGLMSVPEGNQMRSSCANRGFWLLVSLLLLLATAPAQTGSDSFNGSSLSSNWTVVEGGMSVSNNSVSGTTGGVNAIRRNDFTCTLGSESGCNQSSQITLTNGAAWSGVILRASSSGYYFAITDGTATYLVISFPGHANDILIEADHGTSWAAGDTMTFRVSGTLFELLKTPASSTNTVVLARFVDNTFPTGTSGIMTYDTSAQLSQWVGTAMAPPPIGPQLMAVRSVLDESCFTCTQQTFPFGGTGVNHIAVVAYSHPDASVSCTDSQGNSYTQVTQQDNSGFSDVWWTIRTTLLEKTNPSVAPSMTISCTQTHTTGLTGLAFWSFASKGVLVNGSTGLRGYAVAPNLVASTSFTAPTVNAIPTDLVVSDYQTTTAGMFFPDRAGIAGISADAPYLSVTGGGGNSSLSTFVDPFDQVAYFSATASGPTSAHYTNSSPNSLVSGVGVTFALACGVSANCTGAQGTGFWQNKHGQALLTTGGSTSGVCNSGTWLRQYAPFRDLSATASCTTVANYVYNVIKANHGPSPNPKLKAQMLAVALDVYFSDPALGGNKLGASAPIGGLTIDLTPYSAAFGGATSLTASQMLTYAASQSDIGGNNWYGNVQATLKLATDAFSSIAG